MKLMKSHFIAVYLLIYLAPLLANSQQKHLHCGQLIDGINNTLQKEMTVVIDGNKIVAVEKGYTNPPAGTQVIDLKTKTVLPGLMDMHVHLESQTSKTNYSDRFTMNKSDLAFRSVKYAEITLMAGFTTVRDLGGSGVNTSLRDAISQGYVKGPRVFTSRKSLAPTGGHADPTNGYREDLMGNPGPEDGVINGPDDCRKAVRQQYKMGADWIKITATGGVLSVAKDGLRPQFTEEEIKAVVETAADLGLQVAAHAHGTEGIKRAIKGGVTSIEHGSILDDEAIELLKKYKTWYVPTLMAGASTADSAKIIGYYPPVVRQKALEISPKMINSFSKAYKAGVKIAFGTDAGVFAHGKNAKEFKLMTDGGMSPMEAILCATLEAARMLKMENQLGSLEKGKLADIIAVNDNPLQNITTLEKVIFVMKDGVVYKNEK